MTTMRLDYEFKYDGDIYCGTGVDIGDTIDLEAEAKDIEGLKRSAVYNAYKFIHPDFNPITDDPNEAELNKIYEQAEFEHCELQTE